MAEPGGKEIDGVDLALDADLDIVGVVHSHTHTEPYPSPTDVQQAPDPSWHYVIVSLRDIAPMVRSYRIVDGTITEEPVVVRGGGGAAAGPEPGSGAAAVSG